MSAMLPRRVLVVDDDLDFLKACVAVLRRSSFEVDGATDVTTAISHLRTTHYDVVVSDLRMPGLTGISLLRAVREVNSEVPLVLMSGSPSIDSALEAINLGVRRYLTKPFDIDVFIDVVTRAAAPAPAALHASLTERFERALSGIAMVFQPIVTVSARKAFAYEALLRTQATDVVGPGALLNLAEQLGRVHDVGRTVRRQVAGVLDGYRGDAQMFVNLHAADLLDRELYDPAAPLTAHASRVVLEITERASATQESLAEQMSELRALGFRMAVDDLGAGYSGLTTLSRVQPEFVKLDGSLVRGIDGSTVNQRIVTAVSGTLRSGASNKICPPARQCDP